MPESSHSQFSCCRLNLPSCGSRDQKEKVTAITFDGDFVKTAGIKLLADGSPHSGSMAVEKEFFTNELTKTLGFPNVKGRLNYITNAKYRELNKDFPSLECMVKELNDQGMFHGFCYFRVGRTNHQISGHARLGHITWNIEKKYTIGCGLVSNVP